MKKLTSKIAAAFAACACAVPMFSTISANAESEQFNTYRVYYDAAKTGIAEFNIEVRYNTDIKVGQSKTTSLCQDGTFVSVGSQDTGIYLTYYKGSSIMQTGTLATEKMIVPVSSDINDNLYRYISFDGSYANDSSGNKMAPAALRIEAVLVGDANDDGSIDISDAITIIQYVNNPTGYPMNDENRRRAADVDGDGVITTNDADLIQRFLVQLISHF